MAQVELAYFALRGITGRAPVEGLSWSCCCGHQSQDRPLYCLRSLRPLVGNINHISFLHPQVQERHDPRACCANLRLRLTADDAEGSLQQ